MRRLQIVLLLTSTLPLVWQPGPAWAQQPEGHEDTIAQPVPPPLPRKPPPDDSVPEYDAVIPKSDKPWVLGSDLKQLLFSKADTYFDYTSRFTCEETARLADYDGEGEASGERVRNYGYLLIKEPQGRLREYRQRIAKDGKVRQSEVEDEEPFPPAYAWVFLFSRSTNRTFATVTPGDRFDGFDLDLRDPLPRLAFRSRTARTSASGRARF